MNSNQDTCPPLLTMRPRPRSWRTPSTPTLKRVVSSSQGSLFCPSLTSSFVRTTPVPLTSDLYAAAKLSRLVFKAHQSRTQRKHINNGLSIIGPKEDKIYFSAPFYLYTNVLVLLYYLECGAILIKASAVFRALGELTKPALLESILIRRPWILLLEEPSGALDPGVKADMHALITPLCWQHKLTILMVAHDIKGAFRPRRRRHRLRQNPPRPPGPERLRRDSYVRPVAGPEAAAGRVWCGEYSLPRPSIPLNMIGYDKGIDSVLHRAGPGNIGRPA